MRESGTLGQGAAGLHDHVVPRAPGAHLALLQERAHLDLIHGRHDPRDSCELVEVFHGEVGYADRPCPMLFVQPLESSPRLESKARHRPVHKIEVYVREPETTQARVEGSERRIEPLIRAPQLGGHEDFGARNTASADGLANILFIAVDGRSVDVAVARFERRMNRPTGGLPGGRAKDPEPHPG